MTKFFGAAGRGLLPFFSAIVETYRKGIAVWRRAPVLVAVAAIPEFAQHVVEIRLGMFASLDAAHALQNNPLRWDFGYAKIAGLVLALMLVSRYWGAGGSLRHTLRMPVVTLLRLLVGVSILIGSSWLFSLNRAALPEYLDLAETVAGWFVQGGLFLWITATLIEDRDTTLLDAFGKRFPSAVIILLLFLAAMLPALFVHRVDHRIVLCEPMAIQWAVMTFDALVVGAMGTLGGSALYVGFVSGLTWRGWRPLVADRRSRSGPVEARLPA